MSTVPFTPYARHTRGSGPGLLLAHGAGGGIEANYGPIMEGLAARHTVVGVDYPGTGDTPSPSPRWNWTSSPTSWSRRRTRRASTRSPSRATRWAARSRSAWPPATRNGSAPSS